MSVTEAMIAAVWAEEVEPLAQLVEISAAGLEAPIRVSDCPDRLLPGRKQGLISNAQAYPYLPFRLTWAGASKESPFGQARLAIANVDSRIEAGIAAAEDPPSISLSLVRVSAPDTPEAVITDATIGQADFNAAEATAVIRPKDFDLEPACCVSMTPATCPGLF